MSRRFVARSSAWGVDVISCRNYSETVKCEQRPTHPRIVGPFEVPDVLEVTEVLTLQTLIERIRVRHDAALGKACKADNGRLQALISKTESSFETDGVLHVSYRR